MAKTISISELRPGMVIQGIVEQNGPVRIRKSGLVSSPEMVQGLAEMGVLSVNIDPEQTVELDAIEPVPVSQTQFVLNANAEKPKQDADSHLSEQFNRSLFLPSLQRVPSAWQYYSRKFTIALCIALGGFALGWLGGSYPAWLPASMQYANSGWTPAPAIVATDNQQADQQDEDSLPHDATPDKAEMPATGVNLIAGEPVLETSRPANSAEQGEGTTEDAGNTDILDNDISQEQPLTLGYVPENAPQQDETPQKSLSSEGGEISPELLQRFEKAMADLEKESANSTEQPEGEPAPVSYSRVENVLRVDQLPARVMTRLPSLSFSAHMYASNPRDRWVKVNDMELTEGEWISEDLMIDRIEPQHVIMVFQGHQFSMRALSDW